MILEGPPEVKVLHMQTLASVPCGSLVLLYVGTTVVLSSSGIYSCADMVCA